MEMLNEIFAQIFELLSSVLGEEIIETISGFFGEALDFIMGLFA